METPESPDVNPVNPPDSYAQSGPDRGEPPPAPEPVAEAPRTPGEWLRENLFPVAFTALVVGLILYKGLNLLDIAKVAVGLGLVIFIHELGHFLAAKWADVHVETFSIGFGKPIPGCVFRYGETTYKLGWIPLGGYVKMVGEGEGADAEEAEEDPRSFKNKSVGQRMLIISAGVIMNLLLAGVCFVVAYSHGVEEKPPIIGWVDPGSPAWQAGIHSGTVIEQIEKLRHPVFDDIRPIVMGTSKGEKLKLIVRDGPGEPPHEVWVEPSREGEALYPTIGVGPSSRPVLESSKRGVIKPYRKGTAAASAQPEFQGGDRITATTDAEQPDRVTELPAAEGAYQYFEFHRRMTLLQGREVTIRVERASGQTTDIRVAPAFMYSIGARMQMGRVVAVRAGSGAAGAQVISPAGAAPGIQPGPPDAATEGDKLIEVEVANGDRRTRFVSRPLRPGQSGVDEMPLDPLRLPYDLDAWARALPPGAPRTVRLTVLRPAAKQLASPVILEATYDESARFQIELLASPNAPVSIPGLGLAYHVEAVVDDIDPLMVDTHSAGAAVAGPAAFVSPAALAGLKKGDLIKEARVKVLNEKGELEPGRWQEVKVQQWAFLASQLQYADIKELDLRVERSGGQEEVSLRLRQDRTLPEVDRGLVFRPDVQLHKAEDLADAVRLGWHRTWRTVRVIYQNLYAMIFARVSPLTMSGPLTIASVSYNIAGENFWQFILFLGMINVNLAVINFLPIPALDGGHMVLLIYEGIRGKPAPESVQFALQLLGVALILGLMLFVIFLDVRRLFF